MSLQFRDDTLLWEVMMVAERSTTCWLTKRIYAEKYKNNLCEYRSQEGQDFERKCQSECFALLFLPNQNVVTFYLQSPEMSCQNLH